ncbi:MAG: ABC transporter permease [Propionibacteriaceae bacterium]|jgi:peptide/nickel transport system permease protein|nr:ABC transporter permease [Propionibacteriaceae bacterium]
MWKYVARRTALALGTLFVLSLIVYLLVDISIDPLDDLRANPAPNRPQLIASRVAMLELDKSWLVRYWHWFTSFITGDMGTAWRSGNTVSSLMGTAVATSFSLVIAATVIALVLGSCVGIVSALRQYTGFDYSITFVSFILYSLPVFWVAVLLKQFLAIGLNNFLADPGLNVVGVLIFAAVFGLFWVGAIGGSGRRRAVVFLTATAVTFGTIAFIVTTGWLDHPRIGYPGMIVFGLGMTYGITVLMAGRGNRKAILSAFTTWAVGIGVFYGVQWLFYYVNAGWPLIFLLLLSAIGVGCLIGWLFGGDDRAVSMRVAAVVAFLMGAMTFADRLLQAYPSYYNNTFIDGRVISTIGEGNINLIVNNSDFWLLQMDRFTHLLLPTLALVLISFASYTRYQRGAMLEVMNQDYIRTARAKGLPERVVITRHALRNALMPLAAIVPVDLVTLVGGAIMTETIFSWAGMGQLFITSLHQAEIDPIMAYVMITGAFTLIMALLADFFYALLDPRIRVNA